jgi:hypothetical protein
MPAFINNFIVDVFIVYLLILYIGNWTIKTTGEPPADELRWSWESADRRHIP